MRRSSSIERLREQARTSTTSRDRARDEDFIVVKTQGTITTSGGRLSEGRQSARGSRGILDQDDAEAFPGYCEALVASAGERREFDVTVPRISRRRHAGQVSTTDDAAGDQGKKLPELNDEFATRS